MTEANQMSESKYEFETTIWRDKIQYEKKYF